MAGTPAASDDGSDMQPEQEACEMRSANFVLRAVAVCAGLAVIACGLVATPSAAQAASVTASGPVVSGISGKCLDDLGGSSAAGTIVDLWDCNGLASAQDWSVMDDGTIQINGECLDVTGGGTGNGTQVQISDCHGAGAQQWQQQAGALVNPQSGRCLDDPGSATDNGTQLQIYDCNGTPAQQWSLPSANSTTGGDPIAVTYPGGDLVVSSDDDGIDPALMQQILSTTLPQAFGAPAGADLNTLVNAIATATAGFPGSIQPLNVTGGTISVSGSTVTVDIPASDISANAEVPGWVASIISLAVATAISAVAFGTCEATALIAAGALTLPELPALAPWITSVCWGIGTFFWTFSASLLKDVLTGVELTQAYGYKFWPPRSPPVLAVR